MDGKCGNLQTMARFVKPSFRGRILNLSIAFARVQASNWRSVLKPLGVCPSGYIRFMFQAARSRAQYLRLNHHENHGTCAATRNTYQILRSLSGKAEEAPLLGPRTQSLPIEEEKYCVWGISSGCDPTIRWQRVREKRICALYGFS